jgi:hypothetical protein
MRYNSGMKDPYNKLASLLRTQPAVLMDLEQKMNDITGQEGVYEDILRQIDITVDQTLAGLGVTRHDDRQIIRQALEQRLAYLDNNLWGQLGKPDLNEPTGLSLKLMTLVAKVFSPPKGFFIKHELGIQMLEKYPPHNLLKHFACGTVRKLIEQEGFASVMAALRFTQSEEWMHQYFEIAYSNLGPDDFEERDVEHLVLDTKWLDVAEKFMSKKYHNISHLKEFGIIFVIPLVLDTAGTTLRMFTLMLHYQHEVPFYSSLFRRHIQAPNFPDILKSLLRGDVPAQTAPNHGKCTWRVVQRYLAKDNPEDFRLFEPHVNPEAEHWWRAEEDLGRLSRVLGQEAGTLSLGWWTGLDFVGEVFTNMESGKEELASFDLIDQLMRLVRKSQKNYLYHQQEALWNKIFVEYMGREKMDELIEENLISGFITLL